MRESPIPPRRGGHMCDSPHFVSVDCGAVASGMVMVWSGCMEGDMDILMKRDKNTSWKRNERTGQVRIRTEVTNYGDHFGGPALSFHPNECCSCTRE